jgi:hypothetical protein
MTTLAIIREMALTADINAQMPNVPNAPGVNITALKQADPDPMFVTLPIAQVGMISENGILYDQSLIKQISDQIIDKRPEGIMGHIAEEDRATKYPVPDLYWIGAMQVGDKLFGKAYVSPGPARDHMRRTQATGGRIATSIYGRGIYETANASGKALRRIAKLNLEQVDLAPPDRASLKINGGKQYALTAEMENDASNPAETRDQAYDQLIAKFSDDIREITGGYTPKALINLKEMSREEMIERAFEITAELGIVQPYQPIAEQVEDNAELSDREKMLARAADIAIEFGVNR